MNICRITLGDVASRLGVKDARTAEAFCKEHKISIECEKKRKYVWNVDFEAALNNKFLKTLEIKYPTSYKDVYNSIAIGDYLHTYEITKGYNTVNFNSNYIPKSDSANDFLNNIK